MMKEKGMQIDEIIFCDTGKEFPAMYPHIEKVEQYIGMPITVIKAEKSFDYYMFEHIRTRGKMLGISGYGWPMSNGASRWCTDRLKQKPISKYLGKYKNEGYVEYVGFAFDEPKRIKKTGIYHNKQYPLYDWRITEAMALKYCYDHGFDWDGLYTHFNRVSCWCCPFQGIGELRNLYYFYPDLWKELLEMDSKSCMQFKDRYSVLDLDSRFKNELIS